MLTRQLVKQAIIPPPEEEPDDGDEKERIRRAEQRLLPSEPPITDEDSSSTLHASAPEAIDNEDFVSRYRLHRPLSEVHSPLSLKTIVPNSSQDNEAMEAGSWCITPVSSSKPNDDKQELEMRGLQEQSSFPGVTQSMSTPLESTAPNLDDDTLQDAQSPPSHNGKTSGGELLPEYRK